MIDFKNLKSLVINGQGVRTLAINGQTVWNGGEEPVGEWRGLKITNLSTSEWATISMTATDPSNVPTLKCSLDGGLGWYDFVVGETSLILTIGSSILFKGNNETISTSNNTVKFQISGGQVEVKGNVMSLLSERNYESMTSVPGFCFINLFSDNPAITYSDELELPATNLGRYSYCAMFQNCGNMKTAPRILPATEVPEYAYAWMFNNCYKISKSPIIKATSFGNNSLREMFKTTPNLKAIYIEPIDRLSGNWMNGWVNGVNPYGLMVYGGNEDRRGISYIPEGWIVSDSDEAMQPLTFNNVSGDTNQISLVPYGTPDNISLEIKIDDGDWEAWSHTTPTSFNDKVQIRGNGNNSISKDNNNYWHFVISGDVEANGDLRSMLSWRVGTDSIPNYCFRKLFVDCQTLLTAPWMWATAIWDGGCRSMFSNCSRLREIRPMAVYTLTSYSMNSMFANCESLTRAPITFKNNYAYNGCCGYMFQQCYNLEEVPEILPATTLMSECYSNMFVNCSSLKKAPQLPAMTLVANCYTQMFMNCTSLNEMWLAPIERLSDNWMYAWVSGVPSGGVIHYAGNETRTGASYLPSGWTVSQT